MKKIEINGDCQFFEDLESSLNEHRNYNLGLWNLSLSIRDLKLYSKGIKPHRRWKITPLKEYFGITGSADKMLTKLERINEIILEKGEKQKEKNNE